jgi:beta-xylosidase/predicted nucleotidyltransferase
VEGSDPFVTIGPPFKIRRGNPAAVGRNAIHQGGIVDTPTGEWWGFSMMDANSVGRLTALSPVTWEGGWPYFGLPGNLGRTPRIWVKPNTGASDPPAAPYGRSDDFSGGRLQPIWQWNHVPVDGQWSLTERAGHLRLRALPARDLLTARNTLTQRAVGPRSMPTVVLDVSGLKAGDIAGFALFNRPYAWIGITVEPDGPALTYLTEDGGRLARTPLHASRDFLAGETQFSYSTDGRTFHPVGRPLESTVLDHARPCSYASAMSVAHRLSASEAAAVHEFVAAARAMLGPVLKSVRLFGSRARGEGHEHSDVDLALIVEAGGRARRHALYDLAFDIGLAHGVALAPLVLEEERFEELKRRERRIALDIETEGIAL